MTVSRLREQQRTAAGRPVPGRRADGITLALGVWLMVGLIFDFMAHNTGTQDPLFSPSHLMLLVGVVAVAVWLLRGAIGRAGPGGRGLAGLPAGDEGVLVAVILFVVTFVADPLWHVLRGFEKGILALTSPSHAPFFVGVILLLSTPFRTAWLTDPDSAGDGPSLRAFLPTVFSLSLTMAFVGLTFTHVWPFYLDQHVLDGRVREAFGNTLAAGGYPAAVLREVVLRRFLTGIYLGNLILFAPLLLMLRRWRLPVGTATIYMVLVTGIFSVLRALIAGVVIDGLIWLLRPSPERPGAFRLFATTAPLVVWSLYLLAVHAPSGLSLPLEGWAGAIVWSGIGGLALSVIMVPPRAA